MEIILEGNQGKTLVVSGDVIRIEKKAGFFADKREKVIPIRQITSVEVKQPGTFVGFIQFSLAGAKANDSSYTVTGGAMDAVKDENAVVFNAAEKYEIALKIKAYIDDWCARTSLPQNGTTFSAADEIRKLKSLVDEGMISSDEFERKKKQLLGI